MTDSIFDLEQEIMKAWHVVDDAEMLYEYFGDDPFFKGMDAKHADEIMNCMLGLKTLYDKRFRRLFDTFEQVAKEYHTKGNSYEAA
jgi:hypothetical protein